MLQCNDLVRDALAYETVQCITWTSELRKSYDVKDCKSFMLAIKQIDLHLGLIKDVLMSPNDFIWIGEDATCK